MKKYFTFLFIFLALSTFGQITIYGNVINAETKELIAGANVFINNTSYKTVTNTEGKFAFTNLNIQKGELIVNALGYKHEVIYIENKIENNVTIYLKTTPKELEEVLVSRYDKDGYKKWGKLFLDGFIGFTKGANDCKIKNTNSLKFYFSKKNKQLSVTANEPLKIINEALGYEIDYTLEGFEYNTKTNIIAYTGYPVFTKIQKGKRKMQQWKDKQNECYQGSIMHFMRALYRNNIREEGFTVQKAVKVLNEKNNADENNVNQSDSIYKITPQILVTDSFAYAVDSVTAGMYFENNLIISYKNQSLHVPVYSFVKLMHAAPLRIFQNGSYYNSMNFFTEKYWAENEKIARMLPFDFEYENKK